MAMNGCCQCVKAFFVLINLLITVIGLVLLGCALWLFFDTFHYLQIAQSSDEYYRGTYVFMGVGVLMTVVGFLGCVGACRESPCLLGTFFTLVLLVFVAEIASIVWIHMNTEKLRDELNKSMARAIKLEYGQVAPRTQALDVIQRELGCCGGAGPSDWARSRYNAPELGSGGALDALEIGVSGVAGALGVYQVPASCCSVPADDARCETGRRVSGPGQLAGVISDQGCTDRLLDFLQQHMGVVIGVVVAVMALEVLAMMVALSFCITIVRTEQRYKA